MKTENKKFTQAELDLVRKELEKLRNGYDGLITQVGEHKYNIFDGSVSFSPNTLKIKKHPTPRFYLTDFMGTFNSPNAKAMVWQDIINDVKIKNNDILKKSGFSIEIISDFNDYLKTVSDKPMEFRKQFVVNPEVKKSVGNYCSIAAETGGLQSNEVYSDVADFLALCNVLGYEVEIFSTIKPVEGKRSLQEVMLERQKLSRGLQLLTGYEHSNQLVKMSTSEASKYKADEEPGKAVHMEINSREGYKTTAFIDDEKPLIDSVVDYFGKNEGVEMTFLYRIERDGVKEPGYQAPSQHKGIEEIKVIKNLVEILK